MKCSLFDRNYLLTFRPELTSDRVVSVSLLISFVLVIALMPAAWQFGQHAYAANMRLSHEQMSSRHSVDAAVVRIQSGASADYDNPMYVEVQWSEDAQSRTEIVSSPAPIAIGSPMTIWVDDRGQIVDAPLTPTDAKTAAVGLACLWWTSLALIVLLTALSIGSCARRHRRRAWESAYLYLIDSDGRSRNGLPE